MRAQERKLAQLKTEAGLKKAGMNESGVSTPQNVSVAAGRNKFTEKGPTPGEIKRRGKTDEQKRAEAAAAQRAREDEQIRIAAVRCMLHVAHGICNKCWRCTRHSTRARSFIAASPCYLTVGLIVTKCCVERSVWCRTHVQKVQTRLLSTAHLSLRNVLI